MSSLGSTPEKPTRTELLDALTDTRRRRILEVLDDRSAPATERELAAEVVAHEESDHSGEEVESVQVLLRHVHLPKLDDAGLVEWDRADATVRETEHPALHDPRVVETDEDALDGAAVNGRSERHRTVLAVLESRDGPLPRADLAREVAAREADGEPSTETVDEVRSRLHHVLLPKLDGAGLVEYDAGEGTVAVETQSTLGHQAAE